MDIKKFIGLVYQIRNFMYDKTSENGGKLDGSVIVNHFKTLGVDEVQVREGLEELRRLSDILESEPDQWVIMPRLPCEQE